LKSGDDHEYPSGGMAVVPKGPSEVHGLIELVMTDEGRLPAAMKDAMKALVLARKCDERAKRLDYGDWITDYGDWGITGTVY
jgi:hypothetical protein